WIGSTASTQAFMIPQFKVSGGLAIIEKMEPVMITGSATITKASRIACKYLFCAILPSGLIKRSSSHSYSVFYPSKLNFNLLSLYRIPNIADNKSHKCIVQRYYSLPLDNFKI